MTVGHSTSTPAARLHSDAAAAAAEKPFKGLFYDQGSSSPHVLFLQSATPGPLPPNGPRQFHGEVLERRKVNQEVLKDYVQ
jgi:hypothetical protein